MSIQTLRPILDWQHLQASKFTRAQWCADGDGMLVVKQNSTGFRVLDQNARKPVGKFAELQEAIEAAEHYMRQNDPAMYEFLLLENPALA